MKNLCRRLLAGLLIVAMLLTNMPTTAFADTNQDQGGLDEIKEETSIKLPVDISGHWAEKEMTELFIEGYFQGYEDGLSHPEYNITRAQAVTLINRLLGLLFDSSLDIGEEFTDINESDWFYQDVMIAKQNGYIVGYKDMTFKPNQEMTRFEITQLISRLLVDAEENDNSAFEDEESFPSWVKDAVGKVRDFEIINGYEDGFFKGHNTMTRGECLTVLYRCQKHLKDVDKEESIGESETKTRGSSSGKKSESYEVELTAMTPDHGQIGTEIQITGKNITSNNDELKVYFEGSKSGLKEVSYTSNFNNTITLYTEMLQVETYNVYIVSEGNKSNILKFNGQALDVVVKPNATPEFVEAVEKLNAGVKHEIGVVFSDQAFFDSLPAEDKDALEDINQAIEDLSQELQLMLQNYDGLSDEGKQLLNTLMSTDLFSQTGEQLQEATELLSHSTTSEALDNIHTATEAIREVRDKIQWVKTTLQNFIVAVETGAVISDIFGFGAGVALHTIASAASEVLTTIVNPVLTVLDIIIFLLDIMPSNAVKDSFETKIFTENIFIDENFGSIREILGDQRADNILERDLGALLAYSIRTTTELNLLLQHKVQGISYGAGVTVDYVAGQLSIEDDLAKMIEETQNIIEAAYDDPEYFYQHRSDYYDYLDDMDDLVETSNGFLINIMEQNMLQEFIDSDFIIELKKIKNTAIYGLDIAVNNLRYTFEKDYDPILFNQPELEDAEVEEAGIIYIDKPVKIKGTMDFSGESNTQMILEHGTNRMMVEAGVSPLGSIESLISGTIQDFMFGIIDNFIDLDIDLEDVEVKLSFESSDESILSGSWDGESILLAGHKPGMVETVIRADIEQVRNGEIEEEYATIKRNFLVISGDQLNEPFSQGPRIDSVVNDDEEDIYSAYIGDIITVKGRGFSVLPSSYQNLYFGSLPEYNELGLTEFMYQPGYNSFKAEVPDSFGDSIHLIVGPDQDKSPSQMDKWPSNVEFFKVLPTELHYVPPTGIVGETWSVMGRGFSHYALRNVGMFSEFADQPGVMPQSYKGLFNLASQNTLNHNYHNRLDFVFSEEAGDGIFQVITDGVYETESYAYTSHEFSPVLEINGEREGIRPNYVVDEDTGDGLAVWYDVNDVGGMQLISAFADRQTNSFKDHAFISDNIAGIPTAPDEVGLDYNEGIYGIGWIGRGESGNDVFVTTSSDGSNWEEGLNVSASSNASVSPEIGIGDIDGDGDQDIVVVWTENPLLESESSSLKIATLINDSGEYAVDISEISSNNASEASMDLYDNYLAVTWSEETVSPYTKNIHGLFGSYEDGILEYQNNFLVSENSGYDSYASGEDSMDRMKIYKTAGYSDVAIGMDRHTDQPNMYIAWENYAKTTKEGVDFRNKDVFFRVVPSEGTMGEITNITRSIKSSQTPKVTVDGDDTPTIAFMEIGYEDRKYEREEGFETEVYFARSFDNGETFNKPFIKVDSNDNAQRIGHIGLDGGGAADYGLIYQYDHEGRQSIRFYSTQEIDSVEENTLENTKEQNKSKFIMRTYRKGTYYGALLNANEKPNGDVLISKENNSDLMRIVRDHSVMGNISSSPDGKYISYGQEYLMVAEADGSHPIGIFIGEIEYTALDAIWSPSGNYIAFRGIGEMSGYDDGRGGISYVDRNGLKYGYIGDMNRASNTPWAYMDLTEVLLVDQKDDWLGEGVMIVEPARDYYTITDDDSMKSWPAISPDGKYMALVDSYSLDAYDYGKLYLKDTERGTNKALSTSGALPVFSPDSKYIAYNVLSESMRKIKIRGLGDSDYSVVIDTGNNIYQPVFNSDSSKLYFNEKNSETGDLVLKYYDMIGEQVYIAGASSGVTGKVDLMTFTRDMLVNDDVVYITEGDEARLNLHLAKIPESEVRIQAVVFSPLLEINQENLVFNSTNWNIDQSFVISALEDDQDNGIKVDEVRFVISSEDDQYQYGSSVGSRVYITDNDGYDESPPEWEDESHINTESYGENQLKASWPQGKDNVGVTKYRVIVENNQQNEIYNEIVTDQFFISGALQPTVTYTVRVCAMDDMNNRSDELSAFFTPQDNSNPYFNADDTIHLSYLSGSEAEIVWDAAHDDTVINRYNVYLDEVLIGSSSERIYAKTGLESDTTYTLSVRPVDSSDNIGTRIGITFTTYGADDFDQGMGYYDGNYLYGAIHPTYKQWNGRSRFVEPRNLGMEFVLEEYGSTSPVIDAEGNIYTSNNSGKLTKLDKDGNVLWVSESAFVEGEIILHQDYIYFVDSGGGIGICSYSSGEYEGRYITAEYMAKEVLGIDRDDNLILKASYSNNGESYDCILLVGVNNEDDMEFTLIRKIGVSYDFDNYLLSDEGWLYFVDEYSNFLGYDLYSPNDTYHFRDGYYKEKSLASEVVMEEPDVHLTTEMLSGSNEDHDLFLYQMDYEYGSRRYISAFDTEGTFSMDSGGDVYEVKWQTAINGSITSKQVTQTDDGKLIASGYNRFNGYIVCLDTSNGDLLWDKTIEGASFNNKRALVDKNGNIHILDDTGILYKLNMDGELLSEIDTAVDEDTTFSMPIIGNNAIYLTHNGLIKLSDHDREEFSIGEYIKVLEEEETALIPVKLEGNDRGVRYIHYRTENIGDMGYDAAESDGLWDRYDYAAAEGYLKFDKGETVKYAEITIHDDTNNETYEPFKFIIDQAVGGALINEGEDTMIVGIRDDEYQNPLGFTTTSKSVDEGDRSLVMTVNRESDVFLKSCSVDYRIVSEATPEETGYIDQRGTLEFNKGDTEKTITVDLVDDDEYVPGRSFTVVLENSRLVDVDPLYGSLLVDIKDYDNLTGVDFKQTTDIEVNEEAKTYTLNIERENTSGSSIILQASGSAVYGEDYTCSLDLSNMATLEFENDELVKTLTVTIIDDDMAEGKETLSLKLLKGKGTDLEPEKENVFEISILDDDAVLPSRPIANVNKNGGQAVTFYNLLPGASINVYDASGKVLVTETSVYSDSCYVYIPENGEGYYGTQIVGGIESLASNIFSVTDIARETMEIDPDFSEVYTFNIEEYVEHYDVYDMEYVNVSVNEALAENRKIFYIQTYMPFEPKVGGVLADLMELGYEVLPAREVYENRASFMKDDFSKIVYYVTTGTEVLSDIIYYGEVK